MEGCSSGLRKGAWTEEEDNLLRKCVELYGEGKWHRVPSRAGLNRCRKSCRLRWLNYLKPSIKRGVFSADEVDLMVRLHRLLGNRWSLIAGRLPGRTANDVKNYWNTNMRKGKSLAAFREAPRESLQITKANIIKPRPRTFRDTLSSRSSGETPMAINVPVASNHSDPSEATTLLPIDNESLVYWESPLEDHKDSSQLNEIAAWGSENDHQELFSSFFSEDHETDQPTSCTADILVEESLSRWSNCSVDVDLWNLLNW